MWSEKSSTTASLCTRSARLALAPGSRCALVLHSQRMSQLHGRLPAPNSGVAAAPVRSIVQFKEVFLTPRYLAIAMEFVAGGDMFEYVVRKGGLKESEARWFFQQLIVGVDYLHRMVRRLPGPLSSAAAPRRGCVCMFGGGAMQAEHMWLARAFCAHLQRWRGSQATCPDTAVTKGGALAAGCRACLWRDAPRPDALTWSVTGAWRLAVLRAPLVLRCTSAVFATERRVLRPLACLSGCALWCRAWRVEISNLKTRSWTGARGRC